MAALATAVEDEFDFRRLVAVVATLADKDARGMLEILESAVDAVVVSQNTSPRAMPADALGELAVEIFGADRVQVKPALPDAIEAAVALAEEDVDLGLGGVGVLITGSVITVADARKLLVR
jgi:dihydrofolate synthase/folylpolyglutamate synthase